jgi:hypothetical protein
MFTDPIPPCQPSLWEETRAPEENGLSAERWQTLFTWVDKKGACSDHCASAKKIRRVRVVGKLFGPRYNELNGASLKDLLFALAYSYSDFRKVLWLHSLWLGHLLQLAWSPVIVYAAHCWKLAPFICQHDIHLPLMYSCAALYTDNCLSSW